MSLFSVEKWKNEICSTEMRTYNSLCAGADPSPRIIWIVLIYWTPEYAYHFIFISFNLILTGKGLQLVCKRLLCFPLKHEKGPQMKFSLVNISFPLFSHISLEICKSHLVSLGWPCDWVISIYLIYWCWEE